MSMEPTITLDEAKAIVATKTAPRVTEDSIRAKIRSVEFVQVSFIGTLCVITMENGWISTGFSAPADPTNYDRAVGERYAYDNAFKPLWQLEGYLLRETLHDAMAALKAMPAPNVGPTPDATPPAAPVTAPPLDLGDQWIGANEAGAPTTGA